jgi:hypothetical protein
LSVWQEDFLRNLHETFRLWMFCVGAVRHPS